MAARTTNVHRARRIFPQLVANVTGHARELPEIAWSSRSWTHNAFRLFEAVFWRRRGIRPEISSHSRKGTTTYHAHSFEGACALFETWVRSLFRTRIRVRIHQPSFAYPNGMRPALSNFMFAVAIDASAQSLQGNTHQSWSHTCTGSNLLLVVGITGASGADNQTAVPTYNAVNMTQVGSPVLTPSDRYIYLDTLKAPATGAHTVQASFSAGYLEGFSASYSGCGQGSGQPDSSNSGTTTGATSISVATVVVDANCWLVGHINANAGTLTATTNAFARQYDSTVPGGIFDSNGTVGTGSQTMKVSNDASRNSALIVISITPTTHGNNYSLVMAQASFSLTGQALAFTKAMHLAMAQASFALTGIAAGIFKALHYTLSMATASFSVTGSALAFLRGWVKRIRPALGTWTKRVRPAIGTWAKRVRPGIGTWTKRTRPKI